MSAELSGNFGGDDRDRTDDLLNAIQTLSQLSYAPIAITITYINIKKIILQDTVRTFLNKRLY